LPRRRRIQQFPFLWTGRTVSRQPLFPWLRRRSIFHASCAFSYLERRLTSRIHSERWQGTSVTCAARPSDGSSANIYVGSNEENHGSDPKKICMP
jgi:hypothetical protein